MQLRDYQSEFHASALREFRSNVSTLGVMATGLGKTVVFCHIVDSILQANPGKRALIVAHREELIYQAADKYRSICHEYPEIEMADQMANVNPLFASSLVVVSSVQTLNTGKRCKECHHVETFEDDGETFEKWVPLNPNRPGRCPHCVNGYKIRLQKFNPEDFAVVVIDEAHHATARTYRNIVDWFAGNNPNVKILGVTATPDRTDEAALGKVFDSTCFSYGIMEGIDDGWLVPIEQEYVQVDGLDFSKVRSHKGDLKEKDLEEILMMEENAHDVVTPTLEIVGDRPTLFFGVTVNHALQMEEIINRHRPGQAICIHGQTRKDERRDLLKRFSDGEFQYLCGCGVFLEGFDEPRIQAIAMARPTKSRALYAQAIGRGTRPILPPMQASAEDRKRGILESGKPSLLVLDFAGNAAQHKLVSTADILGGNMEDDVIALAVEIVKTSGTHKDMREALLEAQDAVEEKRRQEREARARRAAVKADAAQFQRTKLSPFDLFDIIAPRTPGYLQKTPPTEKQAEILRRNGLEPEKFNTREATRMIDEIFRRRREGLCTFKQARLLHKYGQPVNVSFEAAKSTIDAIAANGWKPIERITA